jgi:hypothetical protein
MSILLWRNGMCFAKGANYKACGHDAEISLGGSINPNFVAILRCSQKITPAQRKGRSEAAGAPTAYPLRVHISNMRRRNFLLAPCLAYNQPLGRRSLVA